MLAGFGSPGCRLGLRLEDRSHVLLEDLDVRLQQPGLTGGLLLEVDRLALRRNTIDQFGRTKIIGSATSRNDNG